MENIKLSNSEKLLFQTLYNSPLTSVNYILGNSTFLDNYIATLLAQEILNPSSALNNWGRVSYVNEFSKILVERFPNFKPFTSEQFFSLLSIKNLEKTTVGKLAHLTEKISEEAFTEAYINNSQNITKFVNVILREHKHLKTDTTKLLMTINKKSSIEILKEGYGQTEGPMIKNLNPEVIAEYRDRFSASKIFASRPTIDFLANNPKHLEALIGRRGNTYYHTYAYWGGWSGYDKGFVMNMYSNDLISKESMEKLIKTIGYEDVFNIIMSTILYSSWRLKVKNQEIMVFSTNGIYDDVAKKINFIIDYKIVENIKRVDLKDNDRKTIIKNLKLGLSQKQDIAYADALNERIPFKQAVYTDGKTIDYAKTLLQKKVIRKKKGE